MQAITPFFRRCTVCLALMASSLVTAGEKDYAGNYRRGGVDSAEQLVLLEDGTYCYAVMAGSLDLLSAGRWKPAANPAGGIELAEVRSSQPVFPAIARHNPDLSRQVVIEFNEYGFSDVNAPVFAVSATDQPPAEFRRLFPGEKHTWSDRYRLPPMDAEQVRYLFVGRMTGQDEERGPLSMTVYRLDEGVNQVRIGFDRNQARPLMNMTAHLLDGTLQVGGSRFGEREPLTPELRAGAQRNCIAPALTGKQDGADFRQGPPDVPMLTPVRTFMADPESLQDDPWFPDSPDTE